MYRRIGLADTDLQFLKDIQWERNTDKVNALAPRIRGQHSSQCRDKGRCDCGGGGGGVCFIKLRIRPE